MSKKLITDSYTKVRIESHDFTICSEDMRHTIRFQEIKPNRLDPGKLVVCVDRGAESKSACVEIEEVVDVLIKLIDEEWWRQNPKGFDWDKDYDERSGKSGTTANNAEKQIPATRNTQNNPRLGLSEQARKSNNSSKKLPENTPGQLAAIRLKERPNSTKSTRTRQQSIGVTSEDNSKMERSTKKRVFRIKGKTNNEN